VACASRESEATCETDEWALSALLHHRLAFIGAPGHRLGGGDALDRTRRRVEERSGVHTEAALQLLANRMACVASSERGGACT
jgi:hypothetical protein